MNDEYQWFVIHTREAMEYKTKAKRCHDTDEKTFTFWKEDGGYLEFNKEHIICIETFEDDLK